MSEAVQPGQRLGRYRVERRLGAGGMGVVFAATDLKLNRPVALKLMHSEFAAHPQLLARFHREIDLLARLDAAHVVGILDQGQLGDVPFLATQYVAGGDLGALLSRRGPMPPATAARICAQVGEALAATHRAGVVHRDVKPSNVLLHDPDAADLHAYLCDFGIARSEGPLMTTAGAVSGTWTYLAPERMSGDSGSAASDLYSVGCLLFACLTGRPPYVGTDLEVAYAHRAAPIPQFLGRGGLVARLNVILRRTLAKDPAQRYVSADELVRELRGAASEPPADFDPAAVRTTSTGMPVLASGRDRRRPVVLAVAVALVLVLVAGLAWWVTDEAPSTVAVAGGVAEPDPTTGDLDGDGLGDLTALVNDDSGAHRVAWHSDGEALDRADSQPEEDAYYQYLSADFDGDAHPDRAVVSAIGSEGTVDFADGETDEFRLDLPRPPKGEDFLSAEATFAGDFDGDGRADLGFALEATPSAPPNPITGEGMTRSCGLWIALAGEDGFDPAEKWAGKIPCFTPVLAVSDLGDDGTDDLIWVADGNTEWQGSVAQYDRLVPLPSTGSSFERGQPVRVPSSRPGSFVKLTSGDLDGDDADEVVAASQIPRQHGDYDLDYLVFPDRRRGLGDPTRARRTTRYSYELQQAQLTVSDVDGDGRDDLVHATAPEIFREPGATTVRPGKDVNIDVLLGREDGTLEAPTQWAACKQCSSSFSIFAPVADYISAGP